MMKSVWLCICCFSFIIMMVSPASAGDTNPAWIDKEIAQREAASELNPQGPILSYEYNGKHYYILSPPLKSADMFIPLYDSEGHYICAPGGGITGRGDGKCPEFVKELKNPETVWSCKESSSSGQFSYYGAWSNVKVSESEDPHALGIEIELWKHNGNFVGLLHEYVGPPFDPPAGKLENITFDNKTGKLSFSVKLSIGFVHSRETGELLPSRDMYEFKGTIKQDSITGVLVKKQMQDDGKTALRKETIVLKRDRSSDELHRDSKSYEEWVEFYDKILKFRGPKWKLRNESVNLLWGSRRGSITLRNLPYQLEIADDDYEISGIVLRCLTVPVNGQQQIIGF